MREIAQCQECGSPLPEFWPKGLCSRCALDGMLDPTNPDEARAASDEHHTAPRFGDYELMEEIARGGMGVVYRARQVSLNRTVALKMILAGQFASKQEVLRFRSEAEAAAILQHANIVSIHETGERDGHHFFSMDYVEGRTLAEIVRDGPLPAQRAAIYTRIIAEAIHYAHSQGVLHRDLKPSNVVIDRNDQPRITDFGLAKRLRGDFGLTVTGQVLGSPNFMPPEQTSAKSGKVGPWSDVYGIGAILYYLLTGRPPFHAGTLEEILLLLRDAEPVSPRLLNPSVPRDLETICLKCLEKEPARRYQNARALEEELTRFLSDEPIKARPPHPIGRIWRWCRRRPATATLAASVLLLLLVVAFGSSLAAWRVERARRAEQGANRDLRHTVSLLELARAEDFFEAHDAAIGVAHLAAILRKDPSNGIAAGRLVSALAHRNWALPLASPMRHSDRVVMVSFSPDGRCVLSACRDGTAAIWDAATGQRLATVRHNEALTSACYSPDGKLFVTASADGTAQIWDATTGQPRAPPLRHDGKVNTAEFSANSQWVLTASADMTARIWAASTGVLERELRGHSREVVEARFSPDGKLVATATDWGGLRIWSADSGLHRAEAAPASTKPGSATKAGETLFRMDMLKLRITALAFSPDGRRLAAAYEDGATRLWDPTRGAAVGEPLVHPDPRRRNRPVWHAVFSPDSRLVLTAGEDGTARLWDASNGHPVGQPLQHEGGINFGAFSPDGKLVVTTSVDKSTRLWDAETGMPLCQPMREHERVVHAAFSPDGSRLVTASYNRMAQVWDIQPRRYTGFEVHPTYVMSVEFSPDGACLLVNSLDDKARVVNARTGQPLWEPVRHSGPVRMGAFSPDGNRVVTASQSRTNYVRDIRTGAIIAGPFEHSQSLRHAGFSPEGERLVTASADGTARVWNARTAQPITPPLPHKAAVVTAQFSPNGRLVLTASEDWTARVWDAQTGQAVTEPLSHSDHVKWAEFSPDGKKIVTASTDNTACIWDMPSGKRVAPPLQHARIVEKAVFSPDGRRVVTVSLDRTARIWDANTGQAMTPPLRHDSPVAEVCFSTNGRRVLTGCGNGLRIWDPDTGRPLTERLETDTWVRSACFDSTGRRIAVGARGARIWDLPPVPVPVTEWFLGFAETVAGVRLSARGNAELVFRSEFEPRARRTLQGTNDFYARLAQWLLADPKKRPISPFAP